MNKQYKVIVKETVSYELTVDASSQTEARKKIREINHGHATLSDFAPDGLSPLHYGNVVIESVKEA